LRRSPVGTIWALDILCAIGPLAVPLTTHFVHALLSRLLKILDSDPTVKVEAGVLQHAASETGSVFDLVRGDYSILILIESTDHLSRVKTASASPSPTTSSTSIVGGVVVGWSALPRTLGG